MKRLFYSLLAILICIVVACQKDFLQSSDVSVSDSEFTLATAKKHFRSLDKRLAKENPVLADPQSSELLWSRSYVEHRANVDFVEVPLAAKRRIIALYNFPQDSLKYAPDNTVSVLSPQRLLFYKGKNNEIQERIVTYIPDREYLVRRKAEVGLNSIKKLQSDFKGYIEYRKLSGEVTLILRVENRKVVRRYRVATSTAPVDARVAHGPAMSTMGQNCTRICFDIEYDHCYHEIIDGELHLFCEPAIKTECNTYCEDIPDPNPNPDPDPNPNPEPEPENYDCNGVKNGSAYIAACGCIGGNTGISGCVEVEAPVSDIDLEDRLDCFNSVPSNSSTSYKITLHVQRTNNYIVDPGHAYITLEKSNGSSMQRLSYGFYPATGKPLVIGASMPINSAIGEERSNESRRSHISYTLNVNSSTFGDAISTSLLKSSYLYDLNDYNCTDYALDVFNNALPSANQISHTGFTKPNDLYDALDTMSSNNSAITKHASSNRPPISTNCNN